MPAIDLEKLKKHLAAGPIKRTALDYKDEFRTFTISTMNDRYSIEREMIEKDLREWKARVVKSGRAPGMHTIIPPNGNFILFVCDATPLNAGLADHVTDLSEAVSQMGTWIQGALIPALARSGTIVG